jgi:beta-1,4-mannosyltransferase
LDIWKSFIGELAKRVDAVLTLSPDTIGQVLDAYPALRDKPTEFVWHPAYESARFPEDRREVLRAARGFGRSERVAGYCGRIRPFKGLDRLAAAFWGTSDPQYRLLIAGKTTQGANVAGMLETMARHDNRMLLDFRAYSDEDFNETLCCCDVFVAPFRQYLHSGSMIHALSAGRPVLTPSTPYSESLRNVLGGDWVRTYAGDLSSALVESALDSSVHGMPPMDEFQPERVGEKAAAWFRSLL